MSALHRIAGRVLVVALSALAIGVVLLRPRAHSGAGPTPGEIVAACDSTEPFFVAASLRGVASDRSRQPYDLDAPALLLFSDTPANRPQYVLATIEQVGAVFGLAYRRADQAIYAAAYQKVQLPFGPGGPGAVYRVDLATGDIDVAIRVPSPGADSHERTIRFDDIAERWTSRSSLGDIELSDDESQLFVANLYDRRIYRFAMPSGQLLGSFDHGAAGESWSASARTFGLAWHDGFIYHGVVNSAEVTHQRSDLRAYVYRSRADGSAMEQVAALDLNYKRGHMSWQSYGQGLEWQPWDDDWVPDRRQTGGAQALNPMPSASDIAFDEAGNMVLGLRDRSSDSLPVFVTDYALTPGPDFFVGYGVGDILRGESDGAAWRFDMSREHFDDDTTSGDESALGGLAAQNEHGLVAAGAYVTERNATDSGVYWFGTADGRRRGAEVVGDPLGTEPFRLSRAWSGAAYADDEPPPHPVPLSMRGPGTLGDIELLCGPDLLPTATPTASLTPPRTATSSPTAMAPTHTLTPSPVPSRTPAPIATATPGPAYLPVSLRERCLPGQQRVDVALVIDASSSMADPTNTGRTKLDAALEAVTEFVGNLALPSDQAAIVVFSSDAWLRQGLTGDRGLLSAALQGIQTATQTRLDRGVAVAHQELTSGRRRSGNQAVMILLTDGLANPVPASVAVEEAALAKTNHITIFTIGLGDELDEWALGAMASRSDYYHWAPDAEDLADIYRRIAVTIPCPAEEFWGRR